ncbi:nodulate formation efficiency C protein [Bradyrhizobium sp. ISRA443]|uniref:nodulate formation efficiency C protein n=1 Tax=unclassified Bradyrhizobium TaxID=2631580 RepID=UPI002478467E|nr:MULTISPECIES: nodulate formation efficiency C protein [unclassified Bradyrhizobium]WGR98216.1 nodulate formation efficiency C protein [Bradyrhizobium sp. ISRA436]WGS05105.1 nodulate formation efficiency C protein [Bradyrhizobium sp. ISRA437]WGS11990.1 nodulate formation efficiency C protein [Bradyrhizobium sp. ISRA443]
MTKMTRRCMLWLCLDLLLICPGAVVVAISDVRAEDSILVDKVKSTWRSQDGDTIEQIISKVAKVAHFVPRRWGVAQSNDGSEYAFFSWSKHRDDKAAEYAIIWQAAPDGALKVVSPYAKPIELGWKAFALSLISSEIANGEKAVNLHFLHNPINFNFVMTAQGRLGDLLRHGRCTIGDPIQVDYLQKVDEKEATQSGLWRALIVVNCNIPGPRYFTRGGVIIFEKAEGKTWEPQSFFAKRIATYPPGSWFDHADPEEQEALEPAKKTLQNDRGRQLRGAAP